jgi:curved DNA-binding protein CbpA
VSEGAERNDAETADTAAGPDPAPLLAALRGAHERSRSGRLHLLAGREARQLRFLGGAIADASSDVSGERLGDVMVRHGLLGQADLERAVEVVLGERKRLGRVLAEMDLLGEDRIREGIGLHTREILLAALSRPVLTVAFEELPEAEVDADFECPLSTLQLALEVARRASLAHVRSVIAGGHGRVLAQPDEGAVRPEGLTLTSAEGFVLSRVDGTLGAADLARMISLPGEEFERSLFGLLATGLVRFVEPAAPQRARREPAPPVEPPAQPPIERPGPPPVQPAPQASAAPRDPPAVRPPVQPPVRPDVQPVPPPRARSADELRQSILEAHRGLERTHYEVLGIGQDAAEADVRAAYARLMRTYHPDALCSPELADVEPQRAAVCLRAGEAYEVLRNATARAAYDNNLKLWRRKVPTPPPPPATASAASPPTPSHAAPAGSGAPAPGDEPSATPPSPPDPVAGAAPPAVPAPDPSDADPADDHLAALAAAKELLGRGEFWDAIQRLEPLLPRLAGPRRARARVLLAEAYAQNPKWRRRAEEALRLAIAESPRDVEARLRLAQLYSDLGLPARAAAVLRAALEIDPRNRAAREALALQEAAGPGGKGRGPGRFLRRP